MARIKNTARRFDPSAMRTSLTRFHLPRRQAWPAWSASYTDTYRGPLTDVKGCRGVWLGRKVEDAEQAAFIIEWKTAEDLKNFQHSPAGALFLQDLPEHDTQASIATSTSRLQDLSLGNEAFIKNGASLLSSRHRRYLTLQWKLEGPHVFHMFVKGRMTITALEVTHSGNNPFTDESWRHARDDVLDYFVPDGFEDRANWPPSPIRHWRTWALVVAEEEDAAGVQAEQQAAFPAATGSNRSQSSRSVWCEFRRWNDWDSAAPELEEAIAQSPLARESWIRAVTQVMPPVTAWEQERWEVQSAPLDPEGEVLMGENVD